MNMALSYDIVKPTLPVALGSYDQYVVPMYESERGWGSKIDGYAGPFETFALASKFMDDFNLKYNSETIVPDYYIVALEPVLYTNQRCNYKTTLN